MLSQEKLKPDYNIQLSFYSFWKEKENSLNVYFLRLQK